MLQIFLVLFRKKDNDLAMIKTKIMKYAIETIVVPFTNIDNDLNIKYIVKLNIYIIMWSCPGYILAYYLDKTTLISLLYWVSNCPGNMPKYYPGNMPKYYCTKYHYRNLHEV